MRKPIAIGLSPNTQQEDVSLSIRLLLQPWLYVQGTATKELERWFRTYFKISYAISFVNARSALYTILHCMGIKQGDEVILQAFTCVAVPNAIIATGAKPIYVDIDQSLNIAPRLIEKKITKKTKAIIVQHTFASSADMDSVLEIANKYKIPVIEDCAHNIGGEYKGKKMGTMGIASCYSFGRDKAFSSVFGGMIVTTDKALGQKIRSYQKQKSLPSYFWVLQQLLYLPLTALVLSLYHTLKIGKILHIVLRRMHILSMPVTQKEKQGEFNPRNAQRMPNAMAELALLQLKKQREYNQRRSEIAAYYQQQLGQKEFTFDKKTPLLRFPRSVQKKKELLSYFAKKGIYIGDWYTQAIDPRGVAFEKIFYQKGSCPVSETLAESIVNLPTYPTMQVSDAERVIGVLRDYERTQ